MSVFCLGAKGLEPSGVRWGKGQHASSGPVGSWAYMLCRFHLRGHFAGRECWQEARAAFGSEREETFEFSVKSKEWSAPPLPAWEPRPLAGTSLARQVATSGCRHPPHPRQGGGRGGGEGAGSLGPPPAWSLPAASAGPGPEVWLQALETLLFWASDKLLSLPPVLSFLSHFFPLPALLLSQWSGLSPYHMVGKQFPVHKVLLCTRFLLNFQRSVRATGQVIESTCPRRGVMEAQRNISS